MDIFYLLDTQNIVSRYGFTFPDKEHPALPLWHQNVIALISTQRAEIPTEMLNILILEADTSCTR